MSVRECLWVLRRRWLTVVLLTLVGGLVATVAAFSVTPIYQSTSSVYFSLRSGVSGSDLFQGADYTQSQMTSYAELATQPYVLDKVIADLGLKTTAKQLAGTVSAEAAKDSSVLHISASDPRARIAARVANSVADHLTDTVKTLSPRTEAGRPAIDATLVAKAQIPRDPVSPRKKLDLAAGVLAGLFLGILAALGREALGTSLRLVSDVEALTGLRVLGQVPRTRSDAACSRLVLDDGESADADAFRRVRNILAASSTDGRPSSVVVSSEVTGEGKSSTAINLAVAMAETGQQVLLVDADLRQASIARCTGLQGSAGLSDVLAGDERLEDAVQTWGVDTLDVLTSGTATPSRSEMLGSEAMRRLSAEAKSRYDVVLLDCAPLLLASDAAVLGQSSSGIVLVAAAGRVSRGEFGEAVIALEGAGAPVLGVVVTHVKRRRGRAGHVGTQAVSRASEAERRAGRRTRATSSDAYRDRAGAPVHRSTDP